MTLNEILNIYKDNGISVLIDHDKCELRLYKDRPHPKSLGDNKYPNIEEYFYFKGTYNLTDNYEMSLVKALGYFQHEVGKLRDMQLAHFNIWEDKCPQSTNTQTT